ncbi:MAG: hypothetical protein H6R08_1947, partial [Proteobacteria bacterium]|nr:hypothetical protein [Pseudomonadota bacterium]
MAGRARHDKQVPDEMAVSQA